MTDPDPDSLPPALRDAALDVARMVRKAGGRAYMVGGAVRDMLLSRSVKDVDLEVFGCEPERLRSILGEHYSIDLVGASFGVIKLKHLDIDVTLPRRESKSGTGHKAFVIEGDPFLPLPEAAARRDFTINALYFDPLERRLEDPHGGLADLTARRLRHVSSHFSEDPLRVLRGMQFIARFGLVADPSTVSLCRSIDPEGLPPERQFEEWSKMLVKGVSISGGLTFLRDTLWLRHYPELEALVGCQQDPAWHPEGDVWNHTLLCLDAFAERRIGDPHEDLLVGLAVLCHDMGKPAVTACERGHIRSLGHDVAGVAPTVSFLSRLTTEERILREVPPLVACHMQPFSLWKAHAGDSAIRRLALKVGRIDRLIRVAHADDEGRTLDRRGGSSCGEDLKWLENAAERLRVAAAAPKPILMGRDLIALGFRPGPDFGVWLGRCFEAQLDGAFDDHEGALEYLRRNVLPGARTGN